MADEGLKKAFLTSPTKERVAPRCKSSTTKTGPRWPKIAVSTTRPALPPTATSRSRNFAATRASTSLLTFSSSSSTSWLPNFTKVTTGNNVGKMTDTAQYTGAHKERFDESGKGKEKEGREDVTAKRIRHRIQRQGHLRQKMISS